MSSKKTRLLLLYIAAALIIALILLFTVVMLFIIPAFKEIFVDFGAEPLPDSTQFVIGISDFFVRYWRLVIPAALIFVAGGGVRIAMLYQQDAPISNAIHRGVVVVLISTITFLLVSFMYMVIAMYAPIFVLGSTV